MATRRTRSNHKVEEIAKLSPAKSTRSALRSTSPAVPTLVTRSSSTSPVPKRGRPATKSSPEVVTSPRTTRGRGHASVSPAPSSTRSDTLGSPVPPATRSQKSISPMPTATRSRTPLSPVASEQTQKKGRGRPKKTVEDNAVVEQCSPAKIAVSPVRKSARGRGKPIQSVNSSEVQPGPPAQPTARRTRSRGRVSELQTEDEKLTKKTEPIPGTQNEQQIREDHSDSTSNFELKLADSAAPSSVGEPLHTPDEPVTEDHAKPPQDNQAIEEKVEPPVTEKSTVKSNSIPTIDVQVIAAIADQLAATTETAPTTSWVQDAPAVENVNFSELTDEHIQQLESVLSSHEEFKDLTETDMNQQPSDYADIPLDDKLIQESLNVDPTLIAGKIGLSLDEPIAGTAETVPVVSPEKTQPELVDKTQGKKTSTVVEPRRSVRVTDNERRALAEKIRQKNIEAEKEMLKKLNPPSEPEAIITSTKPPGKSEKKSTSKKGALKKEQTAKPVTKDSSQKDKPTEDESPSKKNTGAGWIPGQIKVIDRKSQDKAERRNSTQKLKSPVSSDAPELFTPDEPVKGRAGRGKAKKFDDEMYEYPGSDSESSDGEIAEDEENLEAEDDGSDSEWMEEDDPDKLWCVCQKPHDNRFMICCDRCEEWYHGDCVGISKKRGRQMEDYDEEYICSLCKEKEIMEKLEASGELQDMTEPPEPMNPGDVGKVQGEIRKKDKTKKSETKKKRFGTFQSKPPKQHCIGTGCENWAADGRIFCSPACVSKHAKESLKIISREKAKNMGQGGRNPGALDIVVLERHTGRIVTGAHAPNANNLIEWLTRHPTFEVLRPGQQTGHVAPNTFYGKMKSKALSKPAVKESTEPSTRKTATSTPGESSSTTSAAASGPDSITIRSNVRKTLLEVLLTRMKEAEGEKIDKDDVKKTVSTIEHELHKFYGDTNSKYKSRYRSLVFNIKDPKNKGLFRKIVKKKLKPAKLVRMTPDELASKELHQWREQEMKHELEIIQKDEERKAKETVNVRKITHKGEIEVRDERLNDLDTKLTEESKHYDMEERDKSVETLPAAQSPLTKVSSSSTTPGPMDLLSHIMGSGDTTAQHNAHLFDSNCKICTGKQAPPTPNTERQTKKLKVEKVTPKRERKESTAEEDDKLVKEELKDLAKEIEVFEYQDAQIAEAIRQRKLNQQIRNRSPSQEPSSTVKSPISPAASSLPSPPVKKHAPSVWKGFIEAADMNFKFFSTAHSLYGSTDTLKSDLPDCLQMVGRIHPGQVWEYLGQVKNTVTREIIVLRLASHSDEEKQFYKEYFGYLSSKKRCGVVGSTGSAVKDMYIVPLASHEKIPSAFRSYVKDALAEPRPHLLLSVIVRSKTKRPSTTEPPVVSRQKKQKAEDEIEEPYSPPAEPVTADPLLVPSNVEEYDPTQPLVSQQSSVNNSPTNDDEPPLDPIVSAYGFADSKTLNADDVPGAEAYSPGQEDAEAMDTGEEPYDPFQPLVSDDNSQSSTSSALVPPPNISDEVEQPPIPPPNKHKAPSPPGELTEQQKALKALTEQIELQRQKLELQKTQLVQQVGLPDAIKDLMAGKKPAQTSTSEVQPLNMMDYLKRTIASKKATSGQLQAPPLPPTLSSSSDPPSKEINDRPKVSFSLSGRSLPSTASAAKEDSPPPVGLTPLPTTTGNVQPPVSQPLPATTFDYSHQPQRIQTASITHPSNGPPPTQPGRMLPFSPRPPDDQDRRDPRYYGDRYDRRPPGDFRGDHREDPRGDPRSYRRHYDRDRDHDRGRDDYHDQGRGPMGGRYDRPPYGRDPRDRGRHY